MSARSIESTSQPKNINTRTVERVSADRDELERR